MRHMNFTSMILVLVLNVACTYQEKSEEQSASGSSAAGNEAVVRIQPVVKSAMVNAEAKTITINVSMLNGCGDHVISIDRPSYCEEIAPPHCSTGAWVTTSKHCDSKGLLEKVKVISREKTVTFAELGIVGDRLKYLAAATLSIQGSDGSFALVRLPGRGPNFSESK